jgi:hypothetical protein
MYDQDYPSLTHDTVYRTLIYFTRVENKVNKHFILKNREQQILSAQM